MKHTNQSINQSINQSNKFIWRQYPRHSQAQWWQPNRCSTAKSIKQFCNSNGPSGVLVSMGKRPSSKRCVLRRFLKIAAGVAERTDSGRLFQREGAQEWKALTCWSWPQGPSDWFLYMLSVTWFGAMWQASSEDKQFVSHVESCRSANRSWNQL